MPESAPAPEAYDEQTENAADADREEVHDNAHAFGAGSAARAALEEERDFDIESSAQAGNAFVDAPEYEDFADEDLEAPADETGWLGVMSDPAGAPGFVRQAERDQRWQRAPVRLALGLVALLLLLGLGSQTAYHFRHQLAAHWPVTQPWLTRLCAAAGCSIDPLHRIESVSIENSALNPADRADAPGALKLVVTLQNRGSFPVAMPALDLSLTDTSGELVARRALLPTDFGPVGGVLAPGVETPLRLNLAINGRKVSGYTVEVFYP